MSPNLVRAAALGVAILLSAAATSSAALLDAFRSRVEDRLAAGGLSPSKERALGKAVDDLARGPLLRDEVRGARRAVERTDAAIRGETLFDDAETSLALDLLAAVRADRESVSALVPPGGAPDSMQRRLDRADAKVASAMERLQVAVPAKPRRPSAALAALRDLDAAAGALADAFPAMPAFELTDDNAGSPTYQQAVTVRGQVNRISAWYFVHTT